MNEQEMNERGPTRRRSTLLSIMVLGTLVSLASLIGVFAPFTDRATTGTNSAESGEMERAADLKLALEANGSCGAFSDDLTTGIFDVTGLQQGGSEFSSNFCLRNDGSLAVDVSVSGIDLQEVDFACSGDESVFDTTCGADQAGELLAVLRAVIQKIDCSDMFTVFTNHLAPIDGTGSLGTVQSHETICMRASLDHIGQGDASIVAQTDRVTWRYQFDGITP
jgi:hypothetical protein